jgi:hypothetical protein
MDKHGKNYTHKFKARSLLSGNAYAFDLKQQRRLRV